jgi:uncharacterized membrane protein YcaP (DUF421 family)
MLIIAMRLMGKRQIGELEISDLITTFLISEIATLPITDPEIPFLHSIIPIIILLTLEVVISMLLAKVPILKSILSARPTTLIKDGAILQKAMRDARISFDELFSELRSQSIYDISEVKYAILEQNGKITVVQKARFRQPNAEQLHVKVKENGLFHIIIEQGYLNRHGMQQLSLSKKSLTDTLSKKGLSIEDVYLMMINDNGEAKIIPKEAVK